MWPKTEIDVTSEATQEVCKKARSTFDEPSEESVLFALTPKRFGVYSPADIQADQIGES